MKFSLNQRKKLKIKNILTLHTKIAMSLISTTTNQVRDQYYNH